MNPRGSLNISRVTPVLTRRLVHLIPLVHIDRAHNLSPGHCLQGPIGASLQPSLLQSLARVSPQQHGAAFVTSFIGHEPKTVPRSLQDAGVTISNRPNDDTCQGVCSTVERSTTGPNVSNTSVPNGNQAGHESSTAEEHTRNRITGEDQHAHMCESGV